MLASVLSALPFAVAVLEPEGEKSRFRYALANEEYRRLAPEAAQGKGVQPIPRWPDPTVEDLRRALGSGEPWYGVAPASTDCTDGGEPVGRIVQPVSSEDRRYLIDVLLEPRLPPVPGVAVASRGPAGDQRTGARAGPELVHASLLARVAALASSSLTLQRICERTLSGMREEIDDLVTGAIYVLDNDSTILQPLTVFHDREDLSPSAESIAVTTATDAGNLIVNGYQQLTHEHPSSDGAADIRKGPLSCSRWIDLAIERRGRPLGVLELGFDGSGSFGHDEVRLYQGIAAILGNAIGNARSYEAEVLNARIADGVARILGASIREQSEQDLGCECLAVAEALTGSQYAFIAGRAADGAIEVIAFSESSREGCEADGAPARDGAWTLRGPCATVLGSGETFITNDPYLHIEVDDLPAGHPDLTSFMGVPLLGKDGQTVGLVALANRVGGFFLRERETVERLVPAMVEAIERFRAEAKLEENARFADELNHIESIIHASLDLDTIAEEALRTGREALGADSAALSRYEPPNLRITHTSGFEEDMRGRSFSADGDPQGLLALRTQAPVLIRDVLADERVDGEQFARFGIRALMVIPLIVGNKVFGNVYYNFSKPHHFSEAEVRFTQRLSLSLSLATENARLYETERTISNRLQEALLGLPDTVPGVEFAHAYYPATDIAKVGGDFYDIFELSYGNIGVAIGDVAGKGVDAAALTSLVKNSIRAHASERGKTPAQILRLTNEVLYKTTPVESFVTVFFGIIDCRDGRFVYCNGGHPSAAVLRADAEVARLPVTGPVLGALPDVHLEHGETRLSLEDTLFLYTDGLTEARRDGELYGEDRLFAVLAEAPDHRPRKLMHTVVADMMEYSHGQLRDDLALLVVRLSAEAQGSPRQAKFEY